MPGIGIGLGIGITAGLGRGAAQYDQTATFTEAAATTEFRQSEGGMLTYWDLYWHPGSAEDIAAGWKIGRFLWLLKDWVDKPISGDELTRIANGLNFCRESGIKVVLRFAYDETGADPDATLEQCLEHIEQLGPVVTANKDVIAWFEAGFIGLWGEWHNGTINQSTWEWSGPTNMGTPADRLAVIEALLEHFPEDRQISLRHPWVIREWYETAPGIEDRDTDKGRIAFHNDAYLGNSTDAATYLKPGDKDFAIAMGDTQVFNAEFWPGFESLRANYATMVSESAALGLTALNRYGGLERTRDEQGWTTEQYETVLATVGYRPVLVECKHDDTVVADKLRMSVSVRNDGWARIPNKRHLWVRLVGSTTHDFKLTTEDCRDWKPGETVTWEFEAEFPSIPAGTYAVHLGAPDGSASLEDDPRYNVRFANADDGAQAWADGWMSTGTTVNVS